MLVDGGMTLLTHHVPNPLFQITERTRCVLYERTERGWSAIANARGRGCTDTASPTKIPLQTYQCNSVCRLQFERSGCDVGSPPRPGLWAASGRPYEVTRAVRQWSTMGVTVAKVIEVIGYLLVSPTISISAPDGLRRDTTRIGGRVFDPRPSGTGPTGGTALGFGSFRGTA